MSDEHDKICPNCGSHNRPDAQFCRTCGEPLGVEQPAPVGVGAAGAVHEEIASITDPLLQIGPASSSDRIVASLKSVLAEAGPKQAEVLRRCAIPRWFDTGVLAVLREREDGNERVLELLNDYSFVRRLGADRYAYHDEVREALLREWQEQRPAELRQINLRLADYFARRSAAQQAASLGPLPKTFLHTTISIAPAGDWELCAREAVYHTLMADPKAGMQRLRREFQRAESVYRLAEAEALLRVTHDAQLDALDRLWVLYLRARLERAELRLDAAAGTLWQILADPARDAELEANARLTLGGILAETGQWTQAIEQYRASLAYFEAQAQLDYAAETMLRLGEAYRELGFNTGGWYVPAYPQQQLWRALGRAWHTLLALPFYLVVFFMRRTPWALPRPEYLASYQNWLLIWLYRTAQMWYERSRAAFEACGDESGVLRAEQWLAEILLTFGYPRAALARLDQLRARPAAQDPYRRAWIDWSRARALIELGELEEARRLLDPALALFREVGDIRREAAALALLGRVHVLAGETEQALHGYREGLERFRRLRFTAAREVVLSDLRAWRRQVGPGPVAEQIRAVLIAEPEKRYVGRFPRRQLPLLQILTMLALPLALLLLTLAAPTQAVQAFTGQQLLSLQTFYDPVRAAAALLLLLLLYGGIYTLLALVVIFFVPLATLEREQPDNFVTDPEGISRFDDHGELVMRIRWKDVTRWIRVDRRLWERPMHLFSETFVEGAGGKDLRIDGIIAWYTNLQEDIEYRLAAAGSPVKSEDLGFRLIRSKSGATLVAGALLLLLFVAAENGWAGWIYQLLPSPVFAALSMLAFSGVLLLFPIAYWLANRPLQVIRALGLPSRWPLMIGAVGLAIVLLYLVSGGEIVHTVPSANLGILLWGAYVLADALYTLMRPAWRFARITMVLAALALALAVAFPSVQTIYNSRHSSAAERRAALVHDAAPTPRPPATTVPDVQGGIQAAEQVIQQPSASLREKASAYATRGNLYYAEMDYTAALDSYNQALEIYAQLSRDGLSAEERQAAAVLLYNRAMTRRALDLPGWQADLEAACRIDQNFCQLREER